ncbi:MAG: NMD3-related protein [Candidatus Micrarchaeaceae archaeon]
MISLKIYCPQCGRSSDEVEFIGDFCIDCIIGMAKKYIKKEIVVNICRNCNMLIAGNSREELNGMNIAKKLNNPKVGLEVKDAAYGNMLLVTFKYTTNSHSVDFSQEIKVKVKTGLCNICRRVKAGYYEAIVQLRGGNAKAMLDAIEGYIEANGTFISKIEGVGDGYDIYIGDKKIASAFFSAYKLKPERSYTLYGMKNGKKLYRNTYLLRL